MSDPDFESIENVECHVEDDKYIHLNASARLTPAEARAVARELIEQSILLDFAGSDPGERKRHERIPMQYIHYHAKQDPGFDHDGIYGGADIECWIKDQTQKNGLIIAEEWIKESGWLVAEVVQHVEISRSDFESDDEDIAYYEQAIHDGQVFVYNIYSDGAGN